MPVLIQNARRRNYMMDEHVTREFNILSKRVCGYYCANVVETYENAPECKEPDGKRIKCEV